MIDIQLSPSIAALIKSCETVCAKECCGHNAFSFSPFNLIYYLTKYGQPIVDGDIERLQVELADFVTTLRNSDEFLEHFAVQEINAILTTDQMVAVINEISFALTQARVLYANHCDQIEDRAYNLTKILNGQK